MKPWSDTLALTNPLRDLLPPTRRPNGDARNGRGAGGEERRNLELNDGYQRGLADGEKALTEQLYQQRAELQELAHGLLESLRSAAPKVMRDSERQMVSLALAVAEKLVAGLPISVEMVEAVVRDALTQVEGTAQFTVRLHKDDLELLKKSCSPVLKPADEAGDFRFVASPDVTRGGCLVETNFGTVDARRETKLELLKRSLAE